MGWYHAVQILDKRVKNCSLTNVVEPWYMTSAAEGSPGYKEFHDWREEQERINGVQFHSCVEDVSKSKSKSNAENDGEIRLGMISARTADNPHLFRGCIDDIGCNAIYLEKPGAPSVAELESMRDLAVAANVKVFVGFNKNVSSYLLNTRASAEEYTTTGTKKKCDVTFLHNNAYKNTEADLSECFERCAEGMLKNMAIHELAILVTYYGVTVDTIDKVEADVGYSSCKTLKGPASGKDFTDFDKLKFKITTVDGIEVIVAADRCGGDDSVGIVSDSGSGEELARYRMPDEGTVAAIPALKVKYGADAMPYFFAQDPDYLTLKQRVVDNCLDGSTPAEGVASIDEAIETLKVAEYLTPILQEQLS